MAVRRAWPVKGLMLQALLLAGLVAAPLASLALFVPMRRQAARPGAWRRRITPTTRLSGPDGDLPMVSLHVPAHNEPPDMVIETLRSLIRLDYPRYEVILIDDNTDDESLWRPVESWCARHGVKFAHLYDSPGYTSGALYYALRELTSEEPDVLRIVDSDYQVQPGW